MPLRALLDGIDFFAENLKEENRHQNYICPNCPSPLISVIPTKNIIKHFRHKTGEAHYEPETQEHFTGKQLLRKIVRSLGFEATTEYRIGEHITDVYVNSPIPIAIELQCSKCNSEEIVDRTLAYAENGVSTLWILGAKFYNSNKLHKKNCKIERIIQQNQPLIFFPKDINFAEKGCFSIKRYTLWNEYSIQFHLQEMTRGKLIKVGRIELRFDEDKDTRLLKATAAIIKKLDWKTREIQSLHERKGVLEVSFTPHCGNTILPLLDAIEEVLTWEIINDYWRVTSNGDY